MAKKSLQRNDARRPVLRELGRRLQAERRRCGLTQEQLAEASGYCWDYVARIEEGFRNPSYLTVVRLARGLKIPLSRLFDSESAR